MSDKPTIPEGFIQLNNQFPNIDVNSLPINYPDMSRLNKQIEENLSHIIPFEERIKPITDRQDKEIGVLEKQIDVYKVENQSLRLQLEKVNSQLKEESDRLKEETTKRKEAESKLTLKDWKTFLWGGIVGAVITEAISLLSKLLFE